MFASFKMVSALISMVLYYMNSQSHATESRVLSNKPVLWQIINLMNCSMLL